jgi:hypothetical protein
MQKENNQNLKVQKLKLFFAPLTLMIVFIFIIAPLILIFSTQGLTGSNSFNKFTMLLFPKIIQNITGKIDSQPIILIQLPPREIEES